MNDMGEQVAQIGELADRMLAQVYALLREHHIIPNAVQEQMLDVSRSRHGRTGR